MNGRKFLNLVILVIMAVSLLSGGTGQAIAQVDQPRKDIRLGQTKEPKDKKITHADRKAAAERAQAAGFSMPVAGVANMAMPGEAPRYFSVPNYANSPLPGNPVVEWNAIAQEIVQPAPMPGMPAMSSVSMSEAFVYLAYVQAAVYNALVAIEGGYQPYNSLLTAPPTASRDAAVAAAAYNVLNAYFPSAMLDQTLCSSTASNSERPRKNRRYYCWRAGCC